MITDIIFDIIRRRNIKMTVLARRSGYNYQTLYQWRSKKRGLHLTKLDDLLETLDMKIELRRKPRA